MKKLSKEDQKTLDGIVSKLQEHQDTIESNLHDINTLISSSLNEAIQQYNEALQEAEAFRDEIVGKMDEFIDEKSENWQEGDNGQAYASWKEEWEGLDFSEVEEVDEVESPDLEHSSLLEDLPKEPS